MPVTRHYDFDLQQVYETVLPFGDLPVGTRFTLTGHSEIDFLAGLGTSAIEVLIDGKPRWLRARKDQPLRAQIADREEIQA